jgi:hypothetical protein
MARAFTSGKIDAELAVARHVNARAISTAMNHAVSAAKPIGKFLDQK